MQIKETGVFLRFLVLKALDATDLSRVNLVHVEVSVLLQLVLADAGKAQVRSINVLQRWLGCVHFCKKILKDLKVIIQFC